MDLSKITVTVRPRSSWQAVDLGLAMTKRWFWPPLMVSLIITLPIFLLLCWLFNDEPYWAVVIIWWLQGIWEKPTLFYYSRLLFGESLSYRQLLAAAGKTCRIQWFSSLLWRRISPHRSFNLPVSVLEELNGSKRRRRLQILHIRGGASILLTLILHGLLWLFLLATIAFINMMIPDEVVQHQDRLAFFGLFSTDIALWLGCILMYIFIILFNPFYIACGFSLYINSRTHLEAWDTEIAFRRLLARHQQSHLATTKLASILAWGAGILITTCLSLPNASWAQTSATTEPNKPKIVAKQQINEILADHDFGYHKNITNYRLPDFNLKKDVPEPEHDLDFSGIESFIKGMAQLIEILLWGAAIALVVFLLYRYRRWVNYLVPKQWRWKKTPKAQPITEIMGLDIRQSHLPDDLLAHVRTLSNHNPREALSLLYRGTLSKLLHNYQLRFQSSHTEGECCQLVEKDTPQFSDFFHQLTLCWTTTAYGHELPDRSALLALCQQWQQLFMQGDQ